MGLLGIGATVICLAQNGGGIPPGTTRYRLIVPAGLPPPIIAPDNQLTVEGVALGQRLFNEKKLSGNNTQACSSCHKPQGDFNDPGKAVSVGSTGLNGSRNAPPLINLVYERSFFWDGRSPTLRAQALAPIQNPLEMNQSIPVAIQKLSQDPTYAAQFAKAFGSPGITAERIGKAMEQFETTILSGNSRFDQVQRGTATLTSIEKRGQTLFQTPFNPRQGQFGADCARCHGGPLTSDFQFRNNGLDRNPKDAGRGDVTHQAGDNGKFKTPVLRDLTATGPYMHDGRFRTLEEVVQHYSSGIVQSPTLDPGLARQPGGVQLSRADQVALVAFLKTFVQPAYTGNKIAP